LVTTTPHNQQQRRSEMKRTVKPHVQPYVVQLPTRADHQRNFEQQFQAVVQMEAQIADIEKDLIDRKLKLQWAIRTLRTFEMQAAGLKVA
jgi:hypothetical protein